MRFRSLLPCLVLFTVVPFANAQDAQAMLQGGGRPLTLQPSALTADYHAIELKTPGGGGGLLDMIMSPMMMLMGAFGAMGGQQDNSGPPMALMTALDLSWTTGETATFFGQTYLVTYKIDMDLDAISKSKDLTGSNLRLQFVRTDAIQSFTPRPDISPSAYIQMLRVPKPTPAKPEKPAKN